MRESATRENAARRAASPSGSVVSATAGPRPDAIDVEWLGDVLRSHGHDVDIRSVSIEPLAHGMMADTHRVRVRYLFPTDLPTTFVYKSTGLGEDGRRTGQRGYGFPGRPGFYAAEVRFYRDLADRTAVRHPYGWHSWVDPDGSDFGLLLEDVRAARPGDDSRGCTLADAHLAVENLAGLHAAFWSLPDQPGDDLLSRLTPEECATYGRRTQRNVEAVLRSASGPLWNDARSVLELFAEHAERWIAAPGRAVTVTHGDYRLDNLLFVDGADRLHVRAVDWQSILPGSPGRDLGILLGASLPQDLVEDHLAPLLGTYRARLNELGVSGYSADECHDDFRLGLFLGLHHAMTVGLSMGTDPRAAHLRELWTRRCCAAIERYGATELLP